MQMNQSGSLRRWTIGSLCGLIAVTAVSAIGFDIMRRAGSMQPAGTNAEVIMAASAGGHVKAVLHIGQQSAADVFAAEILENVQGADYRGTGRSVELKLGSDTRFIMGATADIKTGAIVQANGVIDDAHALVAARIVVLNDYVHVIR
ncbi:MAG: hypothetical protein ABSD74_12035 [Rhizomicrobium sp.]|jgi:hypothetical protein